MKTSRILLAVAAAMLLTVSAGAAKKPAAKVTMSKAEMLDKIKGGWAGKMIGCSYGGPTEFRYSGIIPDEHEIPWNEHMVKYWFDKSPGLFDDVYMDLTFVEVFDKFGLDAPLKEHASAFANAAYPLWHANKAARYNILQGVDPKDCGYWENNPHADDIDFQIEADYAGLMAPGMVNAASFYTDGIGHLMNYGDGWYGGVYVAAMYSLAFVSNDVNYIVSEALKVIPEQSKYYQCISDVIKCYKKFPNNWEATWGVINRKYGYDIGCPDGGNVQFNIDAVINSAYIVIGLLYGQGNFFRTIDISTRCGQDSDCNPSSAAGILGVMKGYSGIPKYWSVSTDEVADRTFPYTHLSLNQASEASLRHALQVVERNGGSVDGDKVTIATQKPVSVRYEKAFDGHFPMFAMNVKKSVENCQNLKFSGKGVVVKYHYIKYTNYDKNYVGQVEVTLDGKVEKVMNLPIDMGATNELFWKYNMEEGPHTISFKWLNVGGGVAIVVDSIIPYAGKLMKTTHPDE